jgi:hypothetical protein
MEMATKYQTQYYHAQPLRMQITYEVAVAAKDANDEMVFAACRRIIEANRIGWRKHGNPADLQLVMQFYALRFED